MVIQVNHGLTVMKQVAILSGNWSASGNFSGYNAGGERIFVPARQMESLGITRDSKIEFPLYALVVSREFSRLDANGQPTEEKFTRTQAGSIFTTKEALISASNADKMLAVDTAKALQTEIKSSGLTEETFKALAEYAF